MSTEKTIVVDTFLYLATSPELCVLCCIHPPRAHLQKMKSQMSDMPSHSSIGGIAGCPSARRGLSAALKHSYRSRASTAANTVTMQCAVCNLLWRERAHVPIKHAGVTTKCCGSGGVVHIFKVCFLTIIVFCERHTDRCHNQEKNQLQQLRSSYPTEALFKLC